MTKWKRRDGGVSPSWTNSIHTILRKLLLLLHPTPYTRYTQGHTLLKVSRTNITTKTIFLFRKLGTNDQWIFTRIFMFLLFLYWINLYRSSFFQYGLKEKKIDFDHTQCCLHLLSRCMNYSRHFPKKLYANSNSTELLLNFCQKSTHSNFSVRNLQNASWSYWRLEIVNNDLWLELTIPRKYSKFVINRKKTILLGLRRKKPKFFLSRFGFSSQTNKPFYPPWLFNLTKTLFNQPKRNFSCFAWGSKSTYKSSVLGFTTG